MFILTYIKMHRQDHWAFLKLMILENIATPSYQLSKMATPAIFPETAPWK